MAPASGMERMKWGIRHTWETRSVFEIALTVTVNFLKFYTLTSFEEEKR